MRDVPVDVGRDRMGMHSGVAAADVTDELKTAYSFYKTLMLMEQDMLRIRW